MAFSIFKVLKGLRIYKENTLTPDNIDIIPNGTASTTTTIQSSQTTNRTITLPDATDTLVGKATTDVFTNKSYDAAGTGNVLSNVANTHIAAGAAIAYSKLASASTGQALIGNAGTPTMTTLTGDVTVGATGVTAIGANKVTLAMLATLAANSAIANTSGSTATPSAVPMVSSATANAIAIRDANANITYNNVLQSYSTTATAGATTTLTVGSTWQQFFTGTLAQTLQMPVTSTLVLGQSWYVVNNSTGVITINSSGSNLIKTLPAGGTCLVTCILTSGTTAASWSCDYSVGISTADILTNKDIDGGTASSTSRITLPKAATGTLSGLTRKQGTVLYDTTLNKPYYDDGTNLIAFGTGSGGVKNYISNGDAENSTTGWAAYALTESVTFTDADDTVTLASHGLKTGDLVSFTVITSTTGISINTGYYAIVSSSSVFQLASSLANAQAGTALALTTNGTGTMVKSIPMTGTGGSPSSTFTASNTTPLSGNNSFLWTKSANNRMGEGFSQSFTIDTQDKAKVMQISCKYLVSSGTFAAQTGSAGAYVPSDMTVWIYDVTNATMIQPSSYSFLSNSTSIADTFNATFQTAANSTSYRLCFHTYSVSASAYTLQFDSIVVSPATYTYGTPVTDWVSYTPTRVGFGTDTLTEAYWKRVGDSIYLKGRLILGTTTAVSASISFPAGLTVDATKETSTATYEGSIVNNSTATIMGILAAGSDTGISFGSTSGSAALSKMLGTAVGSSTNNIGWAAGPIPITGWSSSVQTSDQTDTRVVGLRARRTTAATAITGTTGVTYDVLYNVVDNDTHGAFNTSTGVYTVPVSGWYKINASVAYAGNATTGGFRAIIIAKNGSTVSQKRYIFGANAAAGLINDLATDDILYLTIGDTLKIQVNQNSGATIALEQTDGNVNFEQILSITRMAGPSAITANETVSCKYFNNAVTSIPNSTVTIVDFATKDHDTHGAWTTGAAAKFTAPISGTYYVNACILLNANTGWAVTDAMQLNVYKNGNFDTLLDYENDMASASNINRASKGNTTIKLNAGDYIDIRFQQTSGGAITLAASGFNYVNIHRIGN